MEWIALFILAVATGDEFGVNHAIIAVSAVFLLMPYRPR